MQDARNTLEREFSEYARLAKLRIAVVSNGWQHAFDAYLIAREDPTPLMVQARENVRAINPPLPAQVAPGAINNTEGEA